MTRKKAFQLMWRLSGFRGGPTGSAEAGCFALVQPNHHSFWKWEPPKPEPVFILGSIQGSCRICGRSLEVKWQSVLWRLCVAPRSKVKTCLIYSLFKSIYLLFSSHLSSFMHVANDN